MTTPQSDPIQTWMEGLGFTRKNTTSGVLYDHPTIFALREKDAAFFYAVMEREKSRNSMSEALAHLKMARQLLFEVEYNDGDRYETCLNAKLERKLRSIIQSLEAQS